MKKCFLTLCAGLISLMTQAATVDVAIGACLINYSEEEGDFMYRMFSKDGTYEFDFDFLDEVEDGKTYTYAQHMNELYSMGTNFTKGMVFRYRDAQLTQTKQDGLVHVDATVTAIDGTLYKVVYQQQPEGGEHDTINVVSSKLIVADNMAAFDMPVVIDGEGDQYAVSLWVKTTAEVVGHYDESAMTLKYCTIYDKKNKKELVVTKASIDIVKPGKDYMVSGLLDASDGKVYRINFHYEVPKPTREETLTMDEMTIQDATLGKHYLEVFGFNTDYDRYVDVVFVAKEFKAGSYGRDMLSEGYSAVKVEETKYKVLDVNLTFSEVETETAKVSGYVIARNSEDYSEVVLFNLTADCIIEREGTGLNGDMDEDFVRDFPKMFLVTDWFEEYHSLYLEAENDDLSTIKIQFNMADDAELSAGIPDGVYPINGSKLPNTVLASIGSVGGSVFPSFAGILKEKGGDLSAQIWYIVSGTVTVGSHGDAPYVLVNALNSNGKKVEVRMGQFEEGVENISAEGRIARKMLIDGQLVIENNGQRYSAQGVCYTK